MPQPKTQASPRASAPAAPPATKPIKAAAAGEVIEVQQGDTLYGISKRYRVAISDLMTLNGLQNPNIKPGQKLTLPAGKKAVVQRQAVEAQPVASAEGGAKPAPTRRAPAAAAPPASEWTGSHTVAAGESLFGIARKHHVKVPELQTANNIADPTKVRPGTVLKVPGEASAPAATAEAVPARSAPATPAAGAGPRTTILNAPDGNTEVAALGAGAPTQSDATPGSKAEPVSAPADPPKLAASGKFRWPAKGKVIAGFGPRQDASHNDGINISVPLGTDVHAAENGVVAYAGNELKGYGNLILVRHEGNWVSAYAHNESLLVKRGDKVKRGQSIAKAGNTGAVDQPQVHFELRQGSKPVDPIPHMEKN